MDKIYDLIIIGGGPAGLSAAIYARRANLEVLLIEEDATGGKLSKINQIENYPGFQSISGYDLALQLIEHAKQYDTQIINDKVIKIENDTVYLKNANPYKAKAILIATGSKQRKLNIDKANEFEGKGISYCATCDGFFFKDKEVIVIGDSNQALQESLYLSNLVSKITIVNRNETLNADSSLISKIKEINKIEIINNSIPESLIIENNILKGLVIRNINTNASININGVGIFPYISFNPSTDFIDQSLLDENGFIYVNNDMSTKKDGLFAAGDCIHKTLRQVVTACSDGAIAATSIIKFLKNKS